MDYVLQSQLISNEVVFSRSTFPLAKCQLQSQLWIGLHLEIQPGS